MRHLLAAFLMLLLLPGAVRAQSAETATTSTDAASPATSNDIVVVATPDGPFPVATDAKSFVDIGTASVQASADAHFFSRCVKPIDNGSLHELIDGQPNREIRAAALNRIVRGYMACYPGYVEGGDYGYCHPRNTTDPNVRICQAFYDRGALIEKVLSTYAPHLAFTTPKLFDPAVLAAFHAREDQFNKTRSKGERIYAEVTSCVVALHPKTALAFLHSDPNGKSEARLRNMLLGTSPDCVGGAKQVTVDPSQFRVYMDDAIYSWAVATNGGHTLIPLSGHESLLAAP